MTLEETISTSFKIAGLCSLAKVTRNDVRSNFGGGSQTPRGSGVHQKLPPGWKLEGKLHSTISQEEQARPRQGKSGCGGQRWVQSFQEESEAGCVHFLKIILWVNWAKIILKAENIETFKKYGVCLLTKPISDFQCCWF